MKSINNYLNTVIKYDYITKFNEKLNIYLPKVTKIILTFDLKNSIASLNNFIDYRL